MRDITDITGIPAASKPLQSRLVYYSAPEEVIEQRTASKHSSLTRDWRNHDATFEARLDNPPDMTRIAATQESRNTVDMSAHSLVVYHVEGQ